MISEINSTNQELQSDAWDWFTTQTVKPEFKRKKALQQPDSNSKLSLGSQLVSFERNSPGKPPAGEQAIEVKDLETYSLQTGLQAVLYAH